MVKSWKNHNIMCSKAAILIQKRWRGVLGRDITSRRMCQVHDIDLNVINFFDSDSDSDSVNNSFNSFYDDQMEMLEASIIIQKIYRGYRQRIKYKRQQRLCRAWTPHFPLFDLELANIIIDYNDKRKK